MDTKTKTEYRFLTRKPGSNYRQLFVKDKWVSARTLYGRFMSAEEPATVEEIALDYNLPIEVVQEAIVYCQSDPPEIREDFEREERNVQARWAQYPRPKPVDTPDRAAEETPGNGRS